MSIAFVGDMEPTLYEQPTSSLPSIFGRSPPASTQVQAVVGRRRLGYRSGLLAIPIAAGLGWALRSRRTGLAAGGIAALALGALRWQMARWFCDTPAFVVDARVGDL